MTNLFKCLNCTPAKVTMPRRKTEMTFEEELALVWDKHQKRLELSDVHFTALFLDSVTRLAMRKVRVATYEHAASDISPDMYATANQTERRHARNLEKMLKDRAKCLKRGL
jgi:predicted secreted Zn-dependent protease